MPEGKPLSAPQKALIKMGLARDIDLALHLPLRYEDETRITSLKAAREGEAAQVEGTITACEIAYRPRRQLVATLDDGTDTCQLRFFSFYPAQQKALEPGTRIRARGELRGGFIGWQMVHPVCKPADAPLPQALTPVYPTVATLPQAYLRKVVDSGLARADLSDTLP
jgi:ATP-dependent DNA helicase RecG